MILLNGFQLAVPLDIASPTDGECTQQPLLRPTGDLPSEQIHIGFHRAQDSDLHAHALQCGNGGGVDKLPVLRYFAGDVPVEHHFTVDGLVQRLPVQLGQQNGS